MKLFNTLNKEKEDFEPIKEGEVGIYSCGPTVYWNQHIGHMYAYIQWDSMVRFFRYLGYKAKWVVNITDVGHLTGDNEGDADTGEDRMEKGAKREGISVWDLADKYINQFEDSLRLLNIQKPDVLPRATKHIGEQISLARKIEKKGLTYKTKKGLVFDTSKFPQYSKFADLKLDKQQKRKDVEDDPEKKQPSDFFLWVTGNPKHIMQWDSPWRRGYPGWHIECTAMSTAYLGDNFDIHTGGIEHIPIHHTNEIAQGFGAYGTQTANYWLHNGWLIFKDEKMSKSLGNIITIQDLRDKGYDPMHFRYLVLTSHYKKGLNFSLGSLDSAKVTYENLLEFIRAWKKGGRQLLSNEKLKKVDRFRIEFIEAVSDDLNFPKAMSVLWKAAKSNIPNIDKLDLILDFDQVLGLNLNVNSSELTIPKKVQDLLKEREKFRKINDYAKSDAVRVKIEKLGFKVKDTKTGALVTLTKKTNV